MKKLSTKILRNAKKNRLNSGKSKTFELLFKRTNRHAYVILSTFNPVTFSINNLKVFSTKDCFFQSENNHVNKENINLLSKEVFSYFEKNKIDFKDVYFNRNGSRYLNNTVVSLFLDSLVNFCA